MSEPAAWYVRDRAAGPPMLFWDEERAKKAAFSCGCGARPLYLSQVSPQENLTAAEREATAQVVAQTATSCGLTDAEREAVEEAIRRLWGFDIAATLRGLLERLK